jgi:hypothetical protein
MKLEITTVDELVTVIQVCAWAFVVFVVMMVFGGTVFSMLYSVIFIAQPIKSMAPIDQAFTKMLNDVMLLMTGSITTLIGMFAINKAAKVVAEKLAPKILPPATPTVNLSQPTVNLSQPTVNSSMPNFNWMGYVNPELDETWTPGPPPTTPPEHLEDDHERAQTALARKEAE